MSTDAATVPLVGGHTALDLGNTVAPREELPDGSRPQDYLTSPAALLTWAARAGWADAAGSELIAEAWRRSPGAGAAALDAVRDLRDALHVTLLDAAALVPQHPDVAAAALQRLHDRWVAAAGRSALRRSQGAVSPGSRAPRPPPLRIRHVPGLPLPPWTCCSRWTTGGCGAARRTMAAAAGSCLTRAATVPGGGARWPTVAARPSPAVSPSGAATAGATSNN